MTAVPTLIRRCQSGSPDAASELFDICWPVAWTTAFRILGRRAAAEDAAQTAILNVFRSLGSFDELRPVEPWVRRIAVNAALNEERRESKHRRVESEMKPREPAREFAGTGSAVVSAVADLPREQRIAVVLHYWLDYSTAEIAETLDVPIGTVASRLSRALATLRMTLEAEHVI
jgi:RNA polymerase sigma-70 factor (ECF subfamily)